mmetsp:Transcript_34891/g.76271  ORF Transcript_34891/g.76271 Transcript_34891/m.76271 type:complete len:245 (-) Transcript_34891:143-877(-)
MTVPFLTYRVSPSSVSNSDIRYLSFTMLSGHMRARASGVGLACPLLFTGTRSDRNTCSQKAPALLRSSSYAPNSLIVPSSRKAMPSKRGKYCLRSVFISTVHARGSKSPSGMYSAFRICFTKLFRVLPDWCLRGSSRRRRGVLRTKVRARARRCTREALMLLPPAFTSVSSPCGSWKFDSCPAFPITCARRAASSTTSSDTSIPMRMFSRRFISKRQGSCSMYANVRSFFRSHRLMPPTCTRPD